MGFTVAELRAKTLSRADMVDNPYISSDECLEFINSGWTALHDVLVAKYEDFQITSTDILLVAGQGTYSLDALDPLPYKLRGVDLKVIGAATRFVPLERFMWEDRGTYPDGPNTFAGQTIRVWYIPKVLPLSDATVAPYGDPPTTQPPGTIASLPSYIQDNWAEFIVLEAAIQCASKEQGMAGNLPDLMARRDQKKIEIIGVASNRDAAAPKVAVRRADRMRGWNGRGVLPQLRTWGQAASLKYMFQGMDVKIQGGIFP